MEENYKIQIPTDVKYLRKYTSIPILIDMLIRKKISLASPNYWEDKNDTYFIEKYCEAKNLKSVLASCFTTKSETFHHWKIFAGSVGGVCVRFELNSFLENFKVKGIKADIVNYKLIKELKDENPKVDELPFLKRKQYMDEGEYRIIYENMNKKINLKEFDIKINNIKRIVLNPWIPKPIAKTLKSLIKSIPECSELEIIRTGMIENETWKNYAKSYKIK